MGACHHAIIPMPMAVDSAIATILSGPRRRDAAETARRAFASLLRSGEPLELQQLHHFLAIIDAGSIKVAARKLDLSPSALTRSMQALERSLGVTLFQRAPEGMIPTEFGRALQRHARAIAIHTVRAQQEIRELTGAARGHLSVGAGPAFAFAVLPFAIPRFRAAHPTTDVSIVEGYSSDMVSELRAGRFDCLFLTVSGAALGDDLAAEVLLPKQRIVLVASRSHPLAGRSDISLAEIWEGPWLMPGPSDFFQTNLFRHFDRAGLPPPAVAIEYTSIPMAKTLLIHGSFLAMTSELLVRDEARDGSIAILEIPGLAWDRDIGVMYRRDVKLRPAAAALLACVREVCAALRARPRAPASGEDRADLVPR